VCCVWLCLSVWKIHWSFSSWLLRCKVCPSHKDKSNFHFRDFFFFVSLLKPQFQEKKLHLCWELSQKKKENSLSGTPIFMVTIKKKTTTSHTACCYLLCYGWCENLNDQKKLVKWDIYLLSCGPSTKIYPGTLFSWICYTSERLFWFTLMHCTTNLLQSLDSYTRIVICISVLWENSSTDRYGQELW